MSLTCRLYDQCFQTEWSVLVPRVGITEKASCISPENSDWYFRLESKGSGEEDESWKIFFSRRRKDFKPQNFLLTVCVRSKDGRNIFLSHNQINRDENVQIWCAYRNTFIQDYPNVNFSENTLTFIFIFDVGTLRHRECHREHKSVQTCGHDYQSLEDLSLDLLKLTDEGSDPDVRLKCGDCTISAHRLILGARSEVFRTMLQSDMREGREGDVEIVDMEPEVFQTFIRYLYTGNLPELSEDTALPLYEAADKYHVNALKSRCRDFLVENLTSKNACEVLATADAHSDDDLKERVILYILNEKIPKDDGVWLKFCDGHPKLAVEVYRHAYK